MWMGYVTYVNESCHVREWVMPHVCTRMRSVKGHGATVALCPDAPRPSVAPSPHWTWSSSCCISFDNLQVMHKRYRWVIRPLQDTAHTLQHTTTHCNTRTATHCNTRTATHCNTRTATHCNTHKRDRWAMLHMWTSHVTYMNEPCHMCEWVMSHIWMRHVTYMNELCHIYEWVISHIWMSHVICMNESCHTYEWVMSHIWVSHVTHMNESCHTQMCSLECPTTSCWGMYSLTWLIHMCKFLTFVDMTHSYV